MQIFLLIMFTIGLNIIVIDEIHSKMLILILHTEGRICVKHTFRLIFVIQFITLVTKDSFTCQICIYKIYINIVD